MLRPHDDRGTTMALTTEEIDLLRTRFRQLSQAPAQAAALFYGRLFEIAPEARALFPPDMEAQGLKMMSTLGLVVSQLHDFEGTRPMLEALARRHVGYGVEPGHYDLLAEPVDFKLRQCPGERCTPEVEAAWAKAFAALTAAMIAAAYPDRGANAPRRA
jgi:nitric oxide dioxygenase